jgi:hypothetical protein
MRIDRRIRIAQINLLLALSKTEQGQQNEKKK